MQSPRVYFNNIGSICTDSLSHGNGLSALLLLTRAAKSSAAKSSASKTRSMESRLKTWQKGYRQTGNAEDHEQYRKALNKATKTVKKANGDFEIKLAAEIMRDSK